jgi:hypothetical protein
MVHSAVHDRVPDLAQTSNQLSVWLRRELASLRYVGPTRQFPQRHVVTSGTPSRYIGKSGALLAEILVANPAVREEVNDMWDCRKPIPSCP